MRVITHSPQLCFRSDTFELNMQIDQYTISFVLEQSQYPSKMLMTQGEYSVRENLNIHLGQCILSFQYTSKIVMPPMRVFWWRDSTNCTTKALRTNMLGLCLNETSFILSSGLTLCKLRYCCPIWCFDHTVCVALVESNSCTRNGIFLLMMWLKILPMRLLSHPFLSHVQVTLFWF